MLEEEGGSAEPVGGLGAAAGGDATEDEAEAEEEARAAAAAAYEEAELVRRQSLSKRVAETTSPQWAEQASSGQWKPT